MNEEGIAKGVDRKESMEVWRVRRSEETTKRKGRRTPMLLCYMDGDVKPGEDSSEF